jgi:hypothetical protein
MRQLPLEIETLWLVLRVVGSMCNVAHRTGFKYVQLGLARIVPFSTVYPVRIIVLVQGHAYATGNGWLTRSLRVLRVCVLEGPHSNRRGRRGLALATVT